MRRFLISLAALPFVALATAQELPRAMKIVVTFPAGGTADVLARLVADQMGKAADASIIIDNRPGANSIIGNEFVARATPDGATMLMIANSFLISAFTRQLTYDTIKSFEPVCKLADSPLVIAVPPNSPYKTLGDLIAATKAKPGTISLGAIGPATAQRVAVEMLKSASGFNVNFVPYASSIHALNALLGNEIPVALVSIADSGAMVADGRLRLLATLQANRIEGWPDLPTAREGGVDVVYAAWFGLVAPAKTPAPTLDKLATAVTKAMDSPDLKARMKPLEFYSSVRCGAAFSDYLRAENDSTDRIVKDAGIKME